MSHLSKKIEFQVFGKVFDRKADKCCSILKSHRRNSKAHTVINLEMAKLLKEKGFIDVLPGQKLCRQCVTEFEKLSKAPENENITETESSQDELASDDDFLQYESPRKKLNSTLESIGVSPVNIHGVAQHSRTSNAKDKLKKVLNVYKENISSAYNVSNVDIEEPPPIYDRDTKNKAEELDRLHAAMKEKLITASNAEKLQILTLVPDSWSRKYCSQYFGVSEYLIRSARELKQRKGILAQASQKKGKAMAQETIDLVHAFYQDDEYSRQLPGKKDYVSIQKGVHKQKRLVLCNLHELFVAFKERNPNAKVGFSKFCMLRPKWCVIAGSSGTHSVCVCTIHQNTILLVDALNWEVTYKDLVNKVVCDASNRECMMHRCINCPGKDALCKFL